MFQVSSVVSEAVYDKSACINPLALLLLCIANPDPVATKANSTLSKKAESRPCAIYVQSLCFIDMSHRCVILLLLASITHLPATSCMPPSAKLLHLVSVPYHSRRS